jgi:RNA polymerase sigma-70 factor (ECF subfamily)
LRTRTSRPAPEEADCDSWVRAAAAGDRRAFERLYDRFAPTVHGILLCRVPFQDVEDLLQEVFVAALSGLPALKDVGSFAAWLGAIARNKATDHHRGSREVLELPADLAAPATGDDAQMREILTFLRSLPETYRETLVLRFVEGLTGPEIAERTGLAPASVRVNLHRGVKLLKRKLHPAGDP